jgi:hypothetical protein
MAVSDSSAFEDNRPILRMLASRFGIKAGLPVMNTVDSMVRTPSAGFGGCRTVRFKSVMKDNPITIQKSLVQSLCRTGTNTICLSCPEGQG